MKEPKPALCIKAGTHYNGESTGSGVQRPVFESQLNHCDKGILNFAYLYGRANKYLT